MELGLLGLGRMGASIAKRLLRDGHRVVVYDVDHASVANLEADGAIGTTNLDDLANTLTAPRAVWVMVPAPVTGNVIDELATHLVDGDIIVDGGNSYYQDDLQRSSVLAERGIRLVDVGTSGGVFGLERGFCLMIGGDDEAVSHLNPIFASLAPGVGSAPRTPGREGEPTTAEQGYLHCGPSGAGHFTKMVHNGIEYGSMAALAEGLNILHHADVGTKAREHDAETAPLRNPDHYSYEFDIPAITEVWRRGSVIGSWLLDLTAAELASNPNLDGYSGRVSDSGEGRWTLLSAVEEGVPAPILAAAIFERFDSRGRDEFANQLLSAMRHQFGGHVEKGHDQKGHTP
ncbi:MAG: decarboxylating 6-phosphogluconate dehydrogenase [Acidimicrobiia bacterium]|nr:decarboxylating 6-phosphogluconate dehydrogenase [Acidimicrobiia bacterium]